MTDNKEPKQVIISENDARGAESPKEVTSGDTLLPMLITAIVLIVLGVTAVIWFT
jgi:hypothetical protein